MARKQDIFGVTVEGDITGLKRAMAEATSLFKNTERSLKNVQKALELDPDNSDLLKQQEELYRQLIKRSEEAARKLKADMQKLQKDANFTDKTALSKEFTELELKYKQQINLTKQLRKEYKELGNVAKETFNVKVDKFFKAFEKSKDIMKGYKNALKDINKSIELDPNNLDLYARKQEILKEAIRVGEKAIADYHDRLNKLAQDPHYHENFHQTREEFVRIAREVEEAKKEVEAFKNSVTSPEFERFNNRMQSLSNSLSNIAESSRYASRLFRSLLTSAFEASKSYETDIANIRRVVSDLTDETIADLKEIAIQTGSTFSDISEYATIAGALGIAEKDISKFARTMTDLNTATGGVFSGEEGAKGIAVFLKQLNLGIEQAENFGSVIAVIGDKYADIGDETVNVATKLTSLNAIVKTNQYELLGLAGVMSDLGLGADTNANAINRAFMQIDKIIGGGVKNAEEKLEEMAYVSGMTAQEFREAWSTRAVDTFLKFTDGLKSNVFNEINKAISDSSDKVEEFASVLGMSSEQFQKAWGSDSKRVFDMYMDALGELGEEGVVASKVLSDLGISSVYTAQTLLRLSGSGNEVRKAIELANQAWNENTALTEKSGVIYDTTERKLQGLYESLKQLGVSLTDSFVPTIKEMVDNFVVLSKNFQQLSPNVKRLTTYFLAFGAGLSPVAKHLGILLDFFVKGEDGVSKYTMAIKSLNDIIHSPVGLIAGMAAIVGIASTMGNEWEKNNVFRQIGRDLQQLSTDFEQTGNVAREVYLSTLEDINEQSSSYLDKLEDMIDRYREEKMSYEDKAKLLNDIKGNIDTMNESLGDEAFYWDEASKSVKSHRDEINGVKDAYLDYMTEIKKQNWLEAHAQEFEEAKNGLTEAENKISESAKNFYEEVKDIPDSYLNMFLEAAKGTDTISDAMEKFKNILPENALTDEQLTNLYNAYSEFSVNIEEAKGVIEGFQQSIEQYHEVENATSENFAEITERIQKSTESADSFMNNYLQNTQEVSNLKELMSSKISEDDEILGYFLEKLDTQKEKYETLEKIEENRLKKIIEQNNQFQTQLDKENQVITDWENWTPSVKHCELVFSISGAPSGFGDGIYNSLGFGGSGGFGNMLANAIGALNSSMNNARYNSGGYRSGVTVNAQFNIGGVADVSRNTVKIWGYELAEAVNEALGEMI